MKQKSFSDSTTRQKAQREAVYMVVASIPQGHVATYGDVAKLAGYPGAARLVGHILKQLPKGTNIPWHRVINAQGKISLPENNPSYLEQKHRLLDEGITFKNEKILLGKHRWRII